MPQLFDQLREFLSEVENEKQASVKKRAAANTEPGSQGGDTSHPSKDVDDNTQPATEGKRSQENSSDVKKTIFNGGVDAAGDSSPSQEDQQFDVGITSASTGEDPASEDDYKSDKEDPGTSHPAKTNDGEKYGSMSFGELRKLASNKANDMLSDITLNMKQAAGSKPMPDFIRKKMEAKNGKKAPAADCDKMAAAGAAAASLTADQQDEFAKQAREVVAGSIEQTIADGLEKAAMVGSYLQAFYKAAEGEAAAPEEESSESPSEESAEHGEGGSESGMEVDPGMMAQMAGEDTGGGAGASPDDAAQELLMALQEQGIDPAELLAMIQQGGAGGAGGDPGAGGMPPEAAKMASAQASVERDLTNLIKYAQSYRKAGKFRFSEAKTAQQRNLRDQIKLCVRDIIG
jgi:hypothetical protein